MEKYMPENNGGTRIPQTIEELKAFCAEKGMPLEKMRFFIGENIQEPKAFGIYRDENDRFVVYKNKADGSRAVRYSGPDEAYAVRELYLKLKSEVDLRRSPGGGSVLRKRGISTGTILLIVFLVLLFLYCKLHKAVRALHGDGCVPAGDIIVMRTIITIIRTTTGMLTTRRWTAGIWLPA